MNTIASSLPIEAPQKLVHRGAVSPHNKTCTHYDPAYYARSNISWINIYQVQVNPAKKAEESSPNIAVMAAVKIYFEHNGIITIKYTCQLPAWWETALFKYEAEANSNQKG